MIKNIYDLLEQYGRDTPYSVGRGFYKHVACGPWASFLIAEPVKIHHLVLVPDEDYKPFASSKQELPERVVRFLGLQDGETLRQGPDALQAYWELIDDYAGKNAPRHRDWEISALPQFSEGGQLQGLEISVCEINQAPASVYYEDKEAQEGWEDWADRCIGIQIGSIVEGSDAEVIPRTLIFPFTPERLEEALASVDEEAAYYWDRDNLTHCLMQRNGETVPFEYGWGQEEKEGVELTQEQRDWLDEQTGEADWKEFSDGSKIRCFTIDEGYF